MPKPPMAVLVPALLVAVYYWAVFVTTPFNPAALGPSYNAIGTDFMVFHAALPTAWHGDLALLFDPDRFTALLNTRYQALLSAPLEYRPFVYPPLFLLLLLPLGVLPFAAAYAVFMLGSAVALAVALIGWTRPRLPARQLAAALLVCPAAVVTLLWGQTAFLVAALLIGGLRLLPRRPILAGLVLGLMAIKPHQAMLLPVALVAAGAWPTIAAAVASATCAAGVSAIVFGGAIWVRWIGASWRLLTGADHKYAAFCSIWDNSVHTCALLLGAGATAATAIQFGFMAAAAAAVAWAFRRPYKPDARLAILLAATPLAAQHTGPYEMILPLAGFGLMLSASSAVPSMRVWILGLCVWLLPAFGQPYLSVAARLAPLIIAVLLIWLLRTSQPRPDAHAPDAHAPDAHAPDAHAPDAHAPDAHAPDAHAMIQRG